MTSFIFDAQFSLYETITINDGSRTQKINLWYYLVDLDQIFLLILENINCYQAIFVRYMQY